jgi:hypothetical protein
VTGVLRTPSSDCDADDGGATGGGATVSLVEQETRASDMPATTYLRNRARMAMERKEVRVRERRAIEAGV